jgi:4-hydroxy-3-methylbut-2-enyl diphosphate reductase IspH
VMRAMRETGDEFRKSTVAGLAGAVGVSAGASAP